MIISKMLCIYYYYFFSLLFLLLYSGILFSHQSIWPLAASIGSTTPVSKMLSQLDVVSLHFAFLCCSHWMNDEQRTDIILITMLIILKSPSWLWSLWLKHPLLSQPIIFSHVYQTPKQHLGWVWIFKPLVKFSPGTSSVFLRVHLQVGAAPLPASNDWGRRQH